MGSIIGQPNVLLCISWPLSDIVQNVIVKRTSERSILLQWSAPKRGKVSLYKVELSVS